MLIPEILNEIDFSELKIREKVHFLDAYFRLRFENIVWSKGIAQVGRNSQKSAKKRPLISVELTIDHFLMVSGYY